MSNTENCNKDLANEVIIINDSVSDGGGSGSSSNNDLGRICQLTQKITDESWLPTSDVDPSIALDKQCTDVVNENLGSRVANESHSNINSRSNIDDNELFSHEDIQETTVSKNGIIQTNICNKEKTTNEDDVISNVDSNTSETSTPSLPVQGSDLIKDDCMKTSEEIYNCIQASTQKICSLLDNEFYNSDSPIIHEQNEDPEVCPQPIVHTAHTPHPSVSSTTTTEKETHSPISTDFQPIILNVCGGYNEMEAEDVNEKAEGLVSQLNEICDSTTSKITNAVDASGKVDSAPKLAFELLQDVARHTVSASQTRRRATPEEGSINSSKHCSLLENDIVNYVSPLAEKACETSNKCNTVKSSSFWSENTPSSANPASSIQTIAALRVLEKPASASDPLHLPPRMPPPTISVAGPTGTASHEINGGSPQLIPSNIIIKSRKGMSSSEKTYSCVFVHDATNSNQSKVAFLISQSSMSGTSSTATITTVSQKTIVSDTQTSGKDTRVTNSVPICSTQHSNIQKTAEKGLSNTSTITTSVTQKTIVSDTQTSGKDAHSRLTSSVQICSTQPTKSQKTIEESISNMITSVMCSYVLRGLEVKDSDLLRVQINKNQNKSEFSCSVCGEQYNSKEGLNFHLNRKVFSLNFHCKNCRETIIFHNKCSLYVHMLKETDVPVLNYGDILSLKPYDFDDDNKPPKSSTSKRLDTHGKQINHNRLTKKPEPKSLKVPVRTHLVDHISASSAPHNKSDQSSGNASCNLSTCHVCQESFSNLIFHLCHSQARKYQCSCCEMLLPSPCAQEAHIKIHSGDIKNIICPECGKKDFQTQDGEDMRTAFNHLDACMHFNRFLAIKCSCNQKFSTSSQLIVHVVKNHLQTVFKCPICMLVFTDQGIHLEHLDKIHNIKENNSAPTMMCQFCRIILKSPMDLKKHVENHVEEFKCISFFKWKCFLCTKAFVDKLELNKHLEEDHPHKFKRCTICYSLFSSRKNLVEHIVQKKCSRSLALKLNYCVDMQAEQLENINFSKFFEVKRKPKSKTNDRKKQAVDLETQREKQTCYITILPKPASSKESGQPNLQKYGIENVRLSEPVNAHIQVVPKITSPNIIIPNKDILEPFKVVIDGKTHTTLSWKGSTVNSIISQCGICKKFIEKNKIADHLMKAHQQQGKDLLILAKTSTNSDASSQKLPEERGSHKELVPESSRDGEILVRPGEAAELRENDKEGTDKGNVDSLPHLSSMFPCLLCGLAFQSLHARDEHVSRLHDGTRMVYHCVVCKRRGRNQVFTKKELVARHITKKHRIVNEDTVSRLIRTEEQNVSSGQKLSALNETDGPSAPKRLRIASEGDYLCGKCGFSSSQFEEFSQHIISHNPCKEPQCPECGLCFTVLMALRKHLLAVHKIKFVDDYLKDKNIEEPKLEEEDMDFLPEIHPFNKVQLRSKDSNNDKSNTGFKTSPSNPLECTVCYKVFDIEADLKTHMRNHGMAFIRSKRHKL